MLARATHRATLRSVTTYFLNFMITRLAHRDRNRDTIENYSHHPVAELPRWSDFIKKRFVATRMFRVTLRDRIHGPP